ncbi:hypothetical protein CNYM01_02229 [Colletotrichum nymphaeae SA-01]|uniref:Uncharacterized protein n=1 Tax=Colletotrichum nymphaeae SA-01 TaxID=1460502 RepID=A0A135T9L5_9PEZI|nr:hypothetical protein CNYM01_02229 [Colletotrichum nymphaeae SA-01]
MPQRLAHSHHPSADPPRIPLNSSRRLPPQHLINSRLRHTIHRVNLHRPRIPQQTQPRHPKARMPHINRIPRPIRNAPQLLILTLQYKRNKLAPINPVRPPDNLETTQHPPTITYVLVLLRPTIQPAPRNLPLAEPPAQLIRLHEVQTPRDGERRHAREDLARVRLVARADAVSAVKVGARDNVRDGLVDVHEGEQAQEGKGVEGAVQEARVLLAPFVSGKSTAFTVLEIRNDLRWRVVQHMRVVARRGTEPPALMLTREHEINRLVPRERLRVAEQVQRDETPIEAVEAQVLRQPVVVLVFAGVQALDVFDVRRRRQLELVWQVLELRRHDATLFLFLIFPLSCDLIWAFVSEAKSEKIL